MMPWNKHDPPSIDIKKAPITPTALPPSYAASSSISSAPITPIVCVHLAGRDKIRIIGFPDQQHILSVVDEAIKKTWPAGIQKQGIFDKDSYEWKLTGTPCQAPGCPARSQAEDPQGDVGRRKRWTLDDYFLMYYGYYLDVAGTFMLLLICR